MITPPAEFLSRMRAVLGAEFHAFEECYSRPAERAIRVNTLKISAQQFAKCSPFPLVGQVPWCENTGLNLLEFEEDGSVRVVYQNDASHLTPETASMAKQSWWQI